MPQATCRCGQALTIPPGGAEWVSCPGCGAKLRVRPKAAPPTPPAPAPAEGDGFIRFRCECGKRLKVAATDSPGHGQCPACGAVVPVPQSVSAPGSSAVTPAPKPGSRTAEMTAADRARLEEWGRAHAQKQAAADADDIPSPSESALPTPAHPALAASRTEAGLRLCPGCRKPVHLGADACRHCGTPVPKR